MVFRPTPSSFLCLPGHFLQSRMFTILIFFFQNKFLGPVLSRSEVLGGSEDRKREHQAPFVHKIFGRLKTVDE